MIQINEILYSQVKTIIEQWNEEGIYAISFFVESNEANEYAGFQNVTDFMISYNTESDCSGAGRFSEERWNYAFWRQDEIPIIDTYNGNFATEQLFAWYREQGISDLGREEENCDDQDMNYIGKGPAGHYQLLSIAADIACRLQTEKLIEQKFGKPIPIIVHGLEYAWYDEEATRKANPHGEADDFLTALRNGFE